MSIARSSSGGDWVTALNAKADILAPLTLADADFTSNNVNLTHTAHCNRLVIVTKTTAGTLTWQSDANGSYTNDDSLNVIVLGAGTITVQAGAGATVVGQDDAASYTIVTGDFSSGVRTAANTLSQVEDPIGTQAIAEAGTDTKPRRWSALRIKQAIAALSGGASQTVAVIGNTTARVADIATGSTTETVVATFSLPALGANDRVSIDFQVTGTGTAGTKNWNIRLGGTGVNGTVVSNYAQTATLPAGRINLSFVNVASQSVQSGVNGGNGFGVSSTARAGAVDTSVPTTVYLTLNKNTGADVMNLEQAMCIRHISA